MDKIGIAIVGLGYWGPNLVRNFVASEKWQIRYVVDNDPSRLSKITTTYPGMVGTSDFARVLDDESVHAVAIATPPHTHFELAQRALLRGKHLLVEKPLCLGARKADELVEIAARQSRVLMVDHTFLYTGAVEKLRDLVKRGEFGRIYYIDSVRINLGLFQLHASVIEDLAPHDISIFNYLLDESPVKVAASTTRCVDDSVADAAYITLKYGSGAIAHAHLSWISPVKVRKTMVAGSRLMAIWDDVEPSEKIRIYDKGVDYLPSDEARAKAQISYRSGDVLIPAIDTTEALQKVIVDFARSISLGCPPQADGLAGAAVVRVLEAAEASSVAGGAFVDI